MTSFLKILILATRSHPRREFEFFKMVGFWVKFSYRVCILKFSFRPLCFKDKDFIWTKGFRVYRKWNHFPSFCISNPREPKIFDISDALFTQYEEGAKDVINIWVPEILQLRLFRIKIRFMNLSWILRSFLLVFSGQMWPLSKQFWLITGSVNQLRKSKLSRLINFSHSTVVPFLRHILTNKKYAY